MAGLAPQNMRQPMPEAPVIPDEELVIDVVEGADTPEMDDAGNILSIEHEDGSVTVSLDGSPLEMAEQEPQDDGHFANLVDRIDNMERSRIAEELLRGIEDDKASRKDWIEQRATGIKLLGLTIEVPALQGGSDGAPVEGMSRVRHPLLLEAVLRFQANARSELLPTDGPVKVRDDDRTPMDAGIDDSLADALEKDLNHYLTAVATEYYPDTDRMLFMLGFGGTAFKKVYYCPLRSRPVIESVDAEDLIVNNAATDLANAKRITHVIKMRPSTVKRMQILGVYRDVDLSAPVAFTPNSAEQAKMQQQGVFPETMNPEDRDREIYECYCELNIKGFEHKYKGKASGLEIPYRVTIDVSSREILAVVRNYDEDEKQELPIARRVFVKYPFNPAMGFYDVGLLHILGNTTNALTAAWREMLDAGMYANFPGFLISKNGTRQNTNIIRVPPGGGAPVDTGGMPLRDAVMPLPYKTPDTAFMGLVDNMAQTGQRIGGTSELQVGEGRPDAPVGTTLAMVEQATKLMSSVHKRLHAAQAEEFKLLVQCFRDNPDSFWQRGTASDVQWDRMTFLKAINDHELVPQADPNTASHSQRIMKATAIKQLQGASPQLYDAQKVDSTILKLMGYANPEQFFSSPEQRNQPPPEIQKAMAEFSIRKQDSDADVKYTEAKTAEIMAKIQPGALNPNQGGKGQQIDTPVDQALAQVEMMRVQNEAKDAQLRQQDLVLRNENEDQKRVADQNRQIIELAKDVVTHGVDPSQVMATAADIANSLGPVE